MPIFKGVDGPWINNYCQVSGWQVLQAKISLHIKLKQDNHFKIVLLQFDIAQLNKGSNGSLQFTKKIR